MKGESVTIVKEGGKCIRYGHFALCCRDEGKNEQATKEFWWATKSRNFVGNQEASESDEDCAFAYDICHNNYL